MIHTADYEKYFPINKDLTFTGMEAHIPDDVKIVTADVITTENMQGELIKIHHFLTSPYTTKQLDRAEAAARRNWAIRSAISVREHFTFAKGSQLVVELAPELAMSMSKEEQADFINSNATWMTAVKHLEQRDIDLKLIKALHTFYWQGVVFGRATIIKKVDFETNKVTKLATINSKRLGSPLIGQESEDLIGVIVDGQGIKIENLIYAPYQDLQLSPHTEFYGYSAIETIWNVAEALNIVVEEDLKEIMKSAWLATIMLQINTQGLSQTDAKDKIKSITDGVMPGKIMAVAAEGIAPIMLDMKPNFAGIVLAIDKLEQIIYKALHVPQFLVQNEGVANRATALQSAQNFIDGVISSDQDWLTTTLSDQWYDPELRKLLHMTEGETLPIRVKRVFNKAKIAKFIDLAASVVQLVNSGIIDQQKALEILDMTDMLERLQKEMVRLDKEKKQLDQEQVEEQTNQDSNPDAPMA